MKTGCGKSGGVAAFLLIAGAGGRRAGLGHGRGPALEREQLANTGPRPNAPNISPGPVAARQPRRRRSWPAKTAGRSTTTAPSTCSPLAGQQRPTLLGNSPGAVLEPSPLLSAELPRLDAAALPDRRRVGWESPQVLDAGASQAPANKPRRRRARQRHRRAPPTARRAARECAVAEDCLAGRAGHAPEHDESRDSTLLPGRNAGNNDLANNDAPADSTTRRQPRVLPQPGAGQSAESLNQREFEDARSSRRATHAPEQAEPGSGGRGPWPSTPSRATARSWLELDVNWAHGSEVVVNLTPLVPVWLHGARTAVNGCCCCGWCDRRPRGLPGHRARCGSARDRCSRTRSATCSPTRELEPVRDADAGRNRNSTMTSLPFQLDPGPLALPPEPGWTPLRVGLTLAWTAALVALLAVGLGGWSLLDLSERRIRFVSAVTHELRTPLTTLRLYLDMLISGLVREDTQRRSTSTRCTPRPSA